MYTDNVLHENLELGESVFYQNVKCLSVSSVSLLTNRDGSHLLNPYSEMSRKKVILKAHQQSTGHAVTSHCECNRYALVVEKLQLKLQL